jgi:chemotaxis protein methyltransferase WspC
MSIARGITNTMKISGVSNNIEFYNLIKSDYNTFRILIENIKVPETWFFRDIECFNYLKYYISENRDKINSKNPLKILSAPCSTGEEPYSVAILAFECGLSQDEIQIVSIDISRESLNYAANGLYRKSSFRNEFNDFQDKYFVLSGEYFCISDKIKEIVTFKEANIVKSNFIEYQSSFNIIFCKNLLIYLNDEARMVVLDNINRLLSDNGTLLVGLSEINFFTRNGFEQIKHDMAFACRKKMENNAHPLISTKLPEINASYTNTFSGTKVKINSKEHTFYKKNEPIISEKLTIDTYSLTNIIKLADEGKFDQAEKICTTILMNDSYNIDVLFYMGMISNALKKSSLAVDYFNKVVYLQPDHYESLIHLSLIYDSSGKKEQSEIYRKRAEKVYLKKMQNSGISE